MSFSFTSRHITSLWHKNLFQQHRMNGGGGDFCASVHFFQSWLLFFNLFVYLALMDGKYLQFSPQNDDNLSYSSTQHYTDRYSGIGLLSRKQLNHQTFLMFAYFVIFHQLDCFRYWFDSWRKQIWHIAWYQVIQPQIEKLLAFKYQTYRCANFFFISCDFIRLLVCVFWLLTAHPCDVDLNIDSYRTFFMRINNIHTDFDLIFWSNISKSYRETTRHGTVICFS